MSIERRIRTEGVEVRDAEGSPPTITGYAAVTYRADDPGTQYVFQHSRGKIAERFMPGAFDRVVSEKQDVRALFNHDPNIVLGRTSAGTLKLSVDEVGLRYEITPPDTQAARDAMESIRRGDVTGSSFGFTIPQAGQRFKEGNPGEPTVREITSVDVLDVSPVTFPAYEATSTEARSVSGFDEWIDERQRALDWINVQAARRRLEALQIESLFIH